MLMVYTEIKERNGKKYYYRVLSVRKGNKISKNRKYLGVNLSKEALFLKKKESDNVFNLMRKNKKKEVIEKLKPKIIEILKSDSKISHLPPRLSEVKRLCCNNSKAKQLFGWESKISIDDGLKRNIDWCKINL